MYKITTLKIKKHQYEITNEDIFMDNGHRTQLLTQSQEFTSCGGMLTPVLSKKAIKQIAVFKRDEIQHNYGEGVVLFKLNTRCSHE